MFGSSQDRARQLAGRTRKERMCSTGSHSGHGSSGTSNQVSQLSRASATLKQSIQEPRVVTENLTHEIGLTRAVRQTSQESYLAQQLNGSQEFPRRIHDDLQSASRRCFSPMVEQRLQAEYLSQVLYNSLTLSDLDDQSQSHVKLPPRHSRYGSLGIQSATSHHLRNITEPVPPTQSSTQQSSILRARLGLPMLPPLPMPALEKQLQIQTTISLRGGAGECDTADFSRPGGKIVQLEHDWSDPWSLPREFQWLYTVSYLGHWRTLITSGPPYDAFLQSLSDKALGRFRYLFDPRPPPTDLMGTAVTARRIFYRTLTAEQQTWFKDVIHGRGQELLKLARGDPGTIQEEIQKELLKDLFATPEDEAKPHVKLCYLLDALQTTPTATAPKNSSHIVRPAGGSVASSSTRAVSEPDVAQRQKLSLPNRSLYFVPSILRLVLLVFKYTLFDRYREAGATDPDIVGVEGTMKYFQETDVDVEGLESLAALEVVQAPTMGEMSREGFVNGWQDKNCDTIDKQKAFIKNLKREMPGNKELFTRIYKYTFTIAKTAGQKAVPLDTAIAYWGLLFDSPLSAVKWTSPSTPWLTWWTEFLTSSWKKSVNKDMWNETLKFAQLTLSDEAMSFWNEESSWPSVIDEFVEWVKNEKRGGSKEEVMEEDY
ncbi:Nn.00g104540.m01.CDS01 [Neocucurbitaria sp. VM-36]